ncbi:MAG: transposase [Clostridiales bacterium]|nr:transposase [Clostridiales bacterium]
MPVPLHVRQVERPKNTIVDDSGRDGPNRYSVRERSSIKYVVGGNPQPRNGRVIGHIIDLRFVPVQEETAAQGPDMLSYGASALVKSVTADMLTDLLDVYPAQDAFAIMAIATLRVIKPSIACSRLSTHYNRTFVSVDYPGAALSPNSVCRLLQEVGQDGRKRKLFYQKRLAAVAADHHIAIDGTLKQDTSKVNDLSAFSYKARVKGCQDVSVLYAYDIELMEPICAEVFPGNSIDASSYPTFIRDNDIRKGIIVADKGFPPQQYQKRTPRTPDLHFLTPIKRNDTRIGTNHMLKYEGILQGMGEHILYKKCAIKGGRYLYAFKDQKKAATEEAGYLARAEKGKDFSNDAYTKKKETFGVIVLESDQDLPPKTVYQCYDDRWMLELVFNRYKSDEGLDQTNVQGDFSLIGSEFINFLSTVATCRIIRKARTAGLLEKMSYGDMMDDLSSAWRRVDAPKIPASDDGYWIHTLKTVFEELEALGLSTPVPKPEPKKRGRPRLTPEVSKPKRPRGRPRKNPIPDKGL